MVTLSKDEDGGVMERTVMLVWIQDEQEKIPEEDAGRTTAFATDDQPQATIRKSVDGSEEADWSDKGWGCCGDDTADDATADDETADDSISPRHTHTHKDGS